MYLNGALMATPSSASCVPLRVALPHGYSGIIAMAMSSGASMVAENCDGASWPQCSRNRPFSPVAGVGSRCQRSSRWAVNSGGISRLGRILEPARSVALISVASLSLLPHRHHGHGHNQCCCYQGFCHHRHPVHNCGNHYSLTAKLRTSGMVLPLRCTIPPKSTPPALLLRLVGAIDWPRDGNYDTNYCNAHPGEAGSWIQDCLLAWGMAVS
jgi:hypothetical protein